MTTVTKRCRDCKTSKPAAEFFRDRKASDGLFSYCKPCAASRTAATRQKRRAKIGEAAYLAEQRAVTQRHRDRNRELVRAKNKVAQHALTELRRRHYDEYRRIYKDALKQAGIGPTP